MPNLNIAAEILDAIKSLQTFNIIATIVAMKPMSADLIRLYELLKNNSQAFAWTPKKSTDRLGVQRKYALLVEDDGIEPTTPCLQSRCSPS